MISPGSNIGIGIEIFLGIIGALTLLIGGIGVANIMYAVVKHRTKEIGVQMALGAKRRYIIGPLVLEALSLTAFGCSSGESEVLPLPEGAHLRSGAAGNRAWMFNQFEDPLLQSAYPELFRNKVIVLAEELGGMFIWINGFGDPYMKGGRGGHGFGMPGAQP